MHRGRHCGAGSGPNDAGRDFCGQGAEPAGTPGGLWPTELFLDEEGIATVFIPTRGKLVPLGRVKPFVIPGAELAVGAGWIGLRSHPRPIGSVVYGGPKVPEWFDSVITEVVRGPDGPPPAGRR